MTFLLSFEIETQPVLYPFRTLARSIAFIVFTILSILRQFVKSLLIISHPEANYRTEETICAGIKIAD